MLTSVRRCSLEVEGSKLIPLGEVEGRVLGEHEVAIEYQPFTSTGIR